MMTAQDAFLRKAVAAAAEAKHIFPEYAACEAALESGWGLSKLAVLANNLFGQKQCHPPHGEGVELPTKEYAHGTWMTVPAMWTKFSDWQECFAERMALLRRLANAYPAYSAALNAKTGEEFVTLVSRRWSTDPQRGAKVLAILAEHPKAVASTLKA